MGAGDLNSVIHAYLTFLLIGHHPSPLNDCVFVCLPVCVHIYVDAGVCASGVRGHFVCGSSSLLSLRRGLSWVWNFAKLLKAGWQMSSGALPAFCHP